MPDNDPVKQVMDKLELVAEHSTEGDTLRIAYKLTNHAGIPVLTYDPAAGDPKQPWPALDEAVYISVEEPDKVHLKRVVAPVPKSANVTTLSLPPVRRLDPAKSRTARFSLKLPLRERSEYFRHHDKAPYKDAKAKVLFLWIGFIPLVDGMKLKPVAPGAEVFRIGGSYAPPEQLFAKWETDCSLKCKVRTDDDSFERV